MMNRKLPLILVLSVIPILVVVSALRSRSARIAAYQENSPAAFAKHRKEVLSQWRSKSYVSLGLTNEIKMGLSGLVSSNLVSDEKRQKAIVTFSSLFRAFSAGNYDAYRQFRFPGKVEWHWKQKAEQELDRYFKNGPLFGSDAMFYSFRTNYGFYPTKHITRKAPEGMDARFEEYVFQYSNRTFYSNYLTGVNFTDARIIITNLQHSPGPLIASPLYPMQKAKCATQATPFPNLGYAESNLGELNVGDFGGLLEFNNSLATVLRKHNEVLICDAFFYVNTSPPDEPFPLLARLYWSPDDELWLADALVVGTIDTLKLRLPVF